VVWWTPDPVRTTWRSKNSSPTGNRTPTPPSSSQSLYRLSHPGTTLPYVCRTEIFIVTSILYGPFASFRIFLQKIIIALSHSTNSQLIMELEILFPCSQDIAIGPYSCEFNSVHILPFYFFKINFNRNSYLCSDLPNDLFSPDVHTKIL
jgi:hypothetical protein